MPDIVITEFMDEAAIREGLAGFDVLYDPTLVDRPDDLARALGGRARRLIVRNRTQVRGPLLAAAPQLAGGRAARRRPRQHRRRGLQGARHRGLSRRPAPTTSSVAEYVIGTAMLLLRGAYGASAEMVAGAWPRNRLMGREISGKRLGLVGFGAIARETAKRAAALGMTRRRLRSRSCQPSDPAWDQPWGRVEPVPFDELVRRVRRGLAACAADAGDAQPDRREALCADEAGRDPDQRGARRRRRRGGRSRRR